MKFDIFNEAGSTKVAFFSNFNNDTEAIFRIAEYNNLKIYLFRTDHLEFVNSYSYNRHLLLSKNKDVLEIYEYILNYIKKNDIGICLFFGTGYPWAKEFLERLQKFSYTACYFSDDPEGSNLTSRYYVKNFHYAFCAGVYFDKKLKIEDQYKKWGARKSKFIPLGAYPIKYRGSLNDLDKRQVDLVYVGGCYFPKVLRMFRLKNHFGNRMLIYGRGWNKSGNLLKTLVLKSIKNIYKVPYIEELPKDKLVDLYQNTKIGFNMHMSFGPSNLRLYELPMNGVMQICDCEHGLGELYEIGKEIVVYKTIGEAIEKIEYYLGHDEERMRIAEAGYLRAKNNYLLEHSFKLIKNEILDDIKNNYRLVYPF